MNLGDVLVENKKRTKIKKKHLFRRKRAHIRWAHVPARDSVVQRKNVAFDGDARRCPRRVFDRWSHRAFDVRKSGIDGRTLLVDKKK